MVGTLTLRKVATSSIVHKRSQAGTGAGTDDGPVILTDDRLSKIGVGLRTLYRQRLRQGHGFDDRHREILQALQRVEAAHRNRRGGYWIAGDVLAAAAHARATKIPRAAGTHVYLASDGAPPPHCVLKWGGDWSPNRRLRELERIIHSDLSAKRFPRSKPQDDGTAIALRSG